MRRLRKGFSYASVVTVCLHIGQDCALSASPGCWESLGRGAGCEMVSCAGSVNSGRSGVRGAVAVAGEAEEDLFLAFRGVAMVFSGALAQI